MHHQAAALYVATVVTNLIPCSNDRVVIQVTIPLLMQHWFVLLRYSNKWVYSTLLILVEVFFEWLAISSLEILHKLHWTGGIIIASMLFAHWMYIIAGGLDLLHTTKRWWCFSGMFRVEPSLVEKEVGLDILHHKGAAYDLSSADTGLPSASSSRSVHCDG